jgi:hypothetical protein
MLICQLPPLGKTCWEKSFTRVSAGVLSCETIFHVLTLAAQRVHCSVLAGSWALASQSGLRCRFAFCEVAGSEALCPPGMNINDPCDEPGGCYSCPAHRDCYIPCLAQQWGKWIRAPGSPYNDMAFCERFPRTSDSSVTPMKWSYMAQTGKSSVARHNFDTMYSSVISIFQILTGVPSTRQYLDQT